MAVFMVARWQLRGESEEKQEKSQTGYSVSQPRYEPGSSVVQARSFTVPATVFVFYFIFIGYTKRSLFPKNAKLLATTVPLPGNGLVPWQIKLGCRGFFLPLTHYNCLGYVCTTKTTKFIKFWNEKEETLQFSYSTSDWENIKYIITQDF
jgi:hypothetical protein